MKGLRGPGACFVPALLALYRRVWVQDWVQYRPVLNLFGCGYSAGSLSSVSFDKNVRGFLIPRIGWKLPGFCTANMRQAPKDLPIAIQEQLKGDVTGKAETFMKLGAAQLQGAVDMSRMELYEQHKSDQSQLIDISFGYHVRS